MPIYRNPRTGEEVELIGDGNEEFYLGHGWAIVEIEPPDQITQMRPAMRGKKSTEEIPPTDKPADNAAPTEGGD